MPMAIATAAESPFLAAIIPMPIAAITMAIHTNTR